MQTRLDFTPGLVEQQRIFAAIQARDPELAEMTMRRLTSAPAKGAEAMTEAAPDH